MALEERQYMLAEEMVKHVLLKQFGIYWEPDSSKDNSATLALSDYYTACVLLGEALTTGWKKFYAAVEQEGAHIHKSLDKNSAVTEQMYANLKEVGYKIDLPAEYIVFVVIAVFGDVCVRLCKSGSESLISDAVSGAKKYIADGGYACTKDLQMNSVNFMEFCDDDEPQE